MPLVLAVSAPVQASGAMDAPAGKDPVARRLSRAANLADTVSMTVELRIPKNAGALEELLVFLPESEDGGRVSAVPVVDAPVRRVTARGRTEAVLPCETSPTRPIARVSYRIALRHGESPLKGLSATAVASGSRVSVCVHDPEGVFSTFLQRSRRDPGGSSQ